MVVREMLATDLGESQSGFYLWATKKVDRWNDDHAEWKVVYIPSVMSDLVKEAQQRNRAVRILYRKDMGVDQADSVQVI